MATYWFERLEKSFRKAMNWKKPAALPMRMFPNEPNEYTWEDWQEEKKRNEPVKYFICETFPNWVGYKLYALDMWWYKIKSRYWVKHHLFDLRQPKGSAYEYDWGYQEPSEQILFACLNALRGYVEGNRNGAESLQSFINEMKASDDPPIPQMECEQKILNLYLWFRDDLPKLVAELEKRQEADGKLFNPKDKDYFSQESKDTRGKAVRETFEFEQEVNRKVNEKLKELIDVREGMWT